MILTDNNVILIWDNRYNHNAINYENNICKPTRHANSDNAMIFPNDVIMRRTVE